MLLLPFGYPGYPQKALAEHIARGAEWLRGVCPDLTVADNVIVLEDCARAIAQASAGRPDGVIVMIASWVEAPNVLNVLAGADLEHLPILLWSLDNEWVESENATISFGAVASAAVLRETFEEFGYRFRFTVGNPGSAQLASEVRDFVRAARALGELKKARLGMLGYASMGMYTGLGDHIKVKRVFGTEVVHIDQYSLLAHLDEADAAEVAAHSEALKREWNVADGVESELLEKNSKVYLGLKRLVREHQLTALTAKCQYEMSIDFGFTPCVALSLLGAEMPASCEGDVYLLMSQMILGGVTGLTTTYGDILSFLEDGIVCAACGFAPKCFLAADRPCIDKHTALYSGMLITSPFKAQEVTIIRLANDKDGFKMHIIEGAAEPMRNFHEIDCPAYAGSVIRFKDKPIEDFKQEIMSQHYAIVPGHWAGALRVFCAMTGIRAL